MQDNRLLHLMPMGLAQREQLAICWLFKEMCGMVWKPALEVVCIVNLLQGQQRGTEYGGKDGGDTLRDFAWNVLPRDTLVVTPSPPSRPSSGVSPDLQPASTPT